jgi:hypothetical protein
MKRSSESSNKLTKHQKIEWTAINETSHKEHVEKYGYSLRHHIINYNRDDCQSHRLHITLYITHAGDKKTNISNMEYYFKTDSVEQWIAYSIDLKKHWSDKSIQLSGRQLPVCLDKKGLTGSWNVMRVYLWTKLTPVPKNENLWVLYGDNLLYWKPKHQDFFFDRITLLRDLKLDRKLPIQELFCYLTIVFNFSSSILKSLFWCNCQIQQSFDGRNTSQRLLWNCTIKT